MITFTDTVSVVRAGAIAGPDDDPIESWLPADVIVTPYAGEFQPVSSTEDVVNQQRTEATHKAFLAAGTDVTAKDRLRYKGLDYQIDGQPERWSPHGTEHHIEVFCLRVEGG